MLLLLQHLVGRGRPLGVHTWLGPHATLWGRVHWPRPHAHLLHLLLRGGKLVRAWPLPLLLLLVA
jgi:hypothetical protein